MRDMPRLEASRTTLRGPDHRTRLPLLPLLRGRRKRRDWRGPRFKSVFRLSVVVLVSAYSPAAIVLLVTWLASLCAPGIGLRPLLNKALLANDAMAIHSKMRGAAGSVD